MIERNKAWEELCEKQHLGKAPRSDEKYRHYKGGMYTILAVALTESSLDPVVVYRSEEKGCVWARPLSDFMSLVDGKPRFLKRVYGL